jgi:DUF4097 and DUF4098 domain-containing protein YvlB
MTHAHFGRRERTMLALACTLALAGTAGEAVAQGVPTPPPAPSVRTPRPPRAPRPPRDFGDDEGVTRIDTTLAFSPTGSVELELVTGDMKVSTWNRDEVRVVATATGDARIQFDASHSHLDMEQSRRDRWSRDGHGTVSYQVTVPAGVRATLGSVAGTIDAAGIRGGAEVSTVSGAVTVRDIGAEATIEAVSGRVTLANVQGDAHVESVSGAVDVSNVTGSLSAESVSGPIVLTDVRGARIRANTVSGALDFTGAVNPAGHYDFETHSGRATLHLASNASAAVSVNTFSGSVTNDYPGAVRRQSGDDDDGQTYEYTLGHGDARIRVETFSGRVIISQGNR